MTIAAPETVLPILPSLLAQAERLIDLRVVPASQTFHETVSSLQRRSLEGALLVVDRKVCAPSHMAPFLSLPTSKGVRQGFVVEDMGDVDQFVPVEEIQIPEGLVYAVDAPTRGDELANWSPEEADMHFRGQGRSPLTLEEGLHWALQMPGVLDPGHCFMTIGSRLKKANGTFDARTPALWISGGTGRDGKERHGAPKVGWCWWRNRHTWLGFASTSGRINVPEAVE